MGPTNDGSGRESRLRTPTGQVLMLTQDVRIDRRILLEADALRADGWKVTVVAMPSDGHAGPDPSGVVRATIPSGTAERERAVLWCYRRLQRMVPMDGGVMRLLKSFAWRTIADPGDFFARVLADSAGKHPADIVVAHDLPLLPLAGELAARFDASLVYDSHELFLGRAMSGGERRRWEAVESSWIGKCDAVITVNASIAKELSTMYGCPGIRVIANAERPLSQVHDVDAIRRIAGLRADARIVLYQGGLVAGRNLETLVDAMAYVRDPSIHLVLLGDGTLGRSLVARGRRRSISERVSVLPAVPQAELLGITASATVGIVPYRANSLNNLLCTPNKLYEFIAAGVPVLSNDLPEIRALVDGYGIGWIASMETARSTASAIEGCFADADAYRRRQEAVRRSRVDISWDREAETLRGIFRDVARRAGRPGNVKAGVEARRS